VLLAVVIGVAVRASVSKLLDGPGSASVYSARVEQLPAWIPSVCLLVAAGFMAWVVKEIQGATSTWQVRQAEESTEGQPCIEEGPRPVWDPLGLSADEEAEHRSRWRSLEVKHGHLGLLANVGLVGMRPRPPSCGPAEEEAASTCSTSEPPGDAAESCAESEAAWEPGRREAPPEEPPEAAPRRAEAAAEPERPGGRPWSELGEEEPPAPQDIRSAEDDVLAEPPSPCRTPASCKAPEAAADALQSPLPAAEPVDELQHGQGPSTASCASKPRKNPNDKDIPMQEILNTLESVDERRVMIVRKIKKLGFKSASRLREHFEQFGLVDNVYVSHSHLQSRTRPASLGFVVMESEEASRSALELGSEQDVGDFTIVVGSFQQLDRKSAKSEEQE